MSGKNSLMGISPTKCISKIAPKDDRLPELPNPLLEPIMVGLKGGYHSDRLYHGAPVCRILKNPLSIYFGFY